MAGKIKNSSLIMDVGQDMHLLLGLPRLNLWNTQGRPTKPKRGTFGFNTETSALEYYNGTYWLEAPMNEVESEV